MTISLDKATFVNDFFTTPLPDGTTLVLNKIDESLLYEGELAEIKAINIEVQDDEGNAVSCSCIIGLGDSLTKISTDHTEYEGEVLTSENMEYCTIEVYED